MLFQLKFLITLVLFLLRLQAQELVFDDIESTHYNIDYALPVPPEVAKQGFILTFPIIGDVEFKPQAEPLLGFQAAIPQSGKKLQWGPLVIDSGTMNLSNDKLIYHAAGKLFDVPITVELKQIERISHAGTYTEIDGARFSIEFKEQPTISLYNGQSVVITAADVILQQNKPIRLRLRFKIFDQLVTATVTISPNGVTFGFIVEETVLGKLIPQISNTIIGSVPLKQLTFALDILPTSKESSKSQATAYISAHADFSVLGMGPSQQFKDVGLSCKIGKQTIDCQAQLKDITIPLVGTFTQAQLSISKFPNKPISVKITTEGKREFPNLGILDIQVNAEITQKGLLFNGTILQPIKYAGLTIEKATFEIDTERKLILIHGVTEIFGSQLRVLLRDDSQEKELHIETELLSKEPIKPFAKTNIPDLKDIALKNPKISVGGSKDEVEIAIGGQVVLFGQTLHATLHLATVIDPGLEGYLEIDLAEEFRLSQIIPELANTEIDKMVFKDLNLILTAADFYDTERKVQYKRGINLYGFALEEGPLEPIAKLTQMPKDTEIVIFGTIGSPKDTQFKLKIPVSRNLKTDRAMLKSLGAEILASPPTLSLFGTIAIKPTEKDDWLDFSVVLGAGAEDIIAEGSLQGEWKNPFGVNNFSLKDVALALKFNYELLVSTGLPDTIGMTGSFEIGKYKVGMAAKGSFSEPEEFVFAGDLNQLSLNDFVDLASKIIKQKIPTDKIPTFEIKDVHFYFVPKNTKIGVFFFDEGLNLEGTLYIPNFTTHGRLTVRSGGIVGEGYVSKVDLGPLHMTGAGPDRVYGTADDGPTMRLALSLQEQELYISGIVELESFFKGETDVYLTLDKMHFKLTAKINNLFEAQIAGEGSLTSNPDIKLLIEFQSDFFNYLTREIDKALSDFQKNANEDLTKAQKNLAPVQARWNELNQEIDSRKAEIEQLKGKVAANAFDVKDMISITKLGIEIGGLEVALGSVKAAYETAHGILEGLKKASYYVVGEGGKLITRNLLGAIQINYVKFEGSARELVGGVMPNLNVTVTILGKKRVLKDLQFDFNHPQQSAQSIANSLVKFVTE